MQAHFRYTDYGPEATYIYHMCRTDLLLTCVERTRLEPFRVPCFGDVSVTTGKCVSVTTGKPETSATVKGLISFENVKALRAWCDVVLGQSATPPRGQELVDAAKRGRYSVVIPLDPQPTESVGGFWPVCNGSAMAHSHNPQFGLSDHIRTEWECPIKADDTDIHIVYNSDDVMFHWRWVVWVAMDSISSTDTSEVKKE